MHTLTLLVSVDKSKGLESVQKNRLILLADFVSTFSLSARARTVHEFTATVY
jgi:hypothetical protein